VYEECVIKGLTSVPVVGVDAGDMGGADLSPNFCIRLFHVSATNTSPLLSTATS
jgi:hypothetical protein